MGGRETPGTKPRLEPPVTPWKKVPLPDYSRSNFRRVFFIGRFLVYASIFFCLGILALLFFATCDETVTAKGKVKPRKDVEVRALDAGILTEVYVRPEDIVKVGETLAKYDDKAIRDELATCNDEIAQAKAELVASDAKIVKLQSDPLPEKLKFTEAERKMAETQLEAAEKELNRVVGLAKLGIASRAAYEEAKSKYELAKTEAQIAAGKEKIVDKGLETAILNEAKAEREKIAVKIELLKDKVKRIQEKLDRTLVRAPAGGQIILADTGGGELVKPGISVKPGEPLFTIATNDEREIHVWVPEDRIRKVEKGQPVRIRSEAFDYQKYGEAIGHIDEKALYAADQQGAKLFWVRAVVDESPFPLPFGSSVTAYIVVARRTLLDMYLINRD